MYDNSPHPQKVTIETLYFVCVFTEMWWNTHVRFAQFQKIMNGHLIVNNTKLYTITNIS